MTGNHEPRKPFVPLAGIVAYPEHMETALR